MSNQEKVIESDLFQIVGEYRNPKFKPWSVAKPEEEVKTLWEIIKKENEAKGIKEIGEGSTCCEHFYEFWGTWIVGDLRTNTMHFLKDSANWLKGIQITQSIRSLY